MPIVPNFRAIQAVSRVMAQSLKDLHEIIESEGDHPKETMVLMMGFVNSVILQLRDKVETLERGLGDQLLAAINVITKADPTERDVLDKLNQGDPSLNESISEIEPDDLPKAIDYFTKKLLDDIETHLKELPLLLRNDEVVLCSLSMIVAHIFNAFDNKNFDDNVNAFTENIRLFADNGTIKQNDKFH